MTSKTSICNRALAKLGQPRVSNIDTSTAPYAIHLSEIYDSVRKAELCAYPWGFAIKQAAIAADVAAPLFDWDNKFSFPADFLALLEIKGNPQYRLIEGKIYTNEGAPLYITYISDITDEGEFDALFVEALAAKLAYESAEILTQSNTKVARAFEDYQYSIKRAYASDAIQDYPELIAPDSWLVSRRTNDASIIENE